MKALSKKIILTVSIFIWMNTLFAMEQGQRLELVEKATFAVTHIMLNAPESHKIDSRVCTAVRGAFIHSFWTGL